MKFTGYCRLFCIAAAGLFLVNCSSLPDDPGLYAVDASGEVQRISGGPKWDKETWEKRSDFPGQLRFFVVHPKISTNTGALGDKIKLRRAGWVRSDINPEGGIGPAGGAQWVAADIDSLNIPLTYNILGERDDIIAAAPIGGALDEGLYILELKDGNINITARFGVNWTQINKSAYASKYCIDRYQANSASAYRRCSDQQKLLAAQGLQLHIVEPEKRLIAGRQAIVVKGIVLNKSDTAREIPTLEGRLVDADGRALHDWRFHATTNEVAPGKSVSFGTVVEGAPANVSNVVVRFADTSEQALSSNGSQ